MGLYDTLASHELMEKLAELEPEEPTKASGSTKTAAAQTPAKPSAAGRLLKIGELLDLSRKAGAARADREFAELSRR